MATRIGKGLKHRLKAYLASDLVSDLLDEPGGGGRVLYSLAIMTASSRSSEQSYLRACIFRLHRCRLDFGPSGAGSIGHAIGLLCFPGWLLRWGSRLGAFELGHLGWQKPPEHHAMRAVMENGESSVVMIWLVKAWVDVDVQGGCLWNVVRKSDDRLKAPRKRTRRDCALAPDASCWLELKHWPLGLHCPNSTIMPLSGDARPTCRSVLLLSTSPSSKCSTKGSCWCLHLCCRIQSSSSGDYEEHRP